jgi:predicted outer membrane repeat protein
MMFFKDFLASTSEALAKRLDQTSEALAEHLNQTYKVVSQLLAVLGCLWFPYVHAAIFTVGPAGTGCTHSNLQTALLAAAFNGPGEDSIRVATNFNTTGLALNAAGHNFILEGGYATCTSTTPGSSETVLNGAGGTLAPVLSLSCTGSGCDTRFRVRLRRLRIQGGELSGLRVDGAIDVDLEATVIESNSATSSDPLNFSDPANRGGGVHLSSLLNSAGLLTRPVLVLSQNSYVNVNTANTYGGGIYCENAEVTLRRDSGLLGNQAGQTGGGITVAKNCVLNAGAGGTLRGILSNAARRGGGGIAMSGEVGSMSQMRVAIDTTAGPPYQMPEISGNSAGDSANSDAVGGGILVGSSSRPVILHAHIGNNTVAGSGAGIFSVSNSSITLGSFFASAAEANLCTAFGQCVLIANNQANAFVDGQNYCSAAQIRGISRMASVRITGNVIALAGASQVRTTWGVLCLDAVASPDPFDIGLFSVLIDKNTGAANALMLFANSFLPVADTPFARVDGITIAENTFATSSARSIRLGSTSIALGGTDSRGELEITNSIIADGTSPWIELLGAVTQSNRFTTMRTTNGVVLGLGSAISSANLFENPALGNFNLLRMAGNPAIDSALCASSRLDLLARTPQDLPDFANTTLAVPGAGQVAYCDRGALEYPATALTETIFANGFE